MDIDPDTVRRLRETRAWSQERLAEIAGLSVRTVQRVERDGGGSLETRMALAAAFEVTPDVLCVAPETAPVAESGAASPDVPNVAPAAVADGVPTASVPEPAPSAGGMDPRAFRIFMVLAAIAILFAIFLVFGYLFGRDLALKERRDACLEQARTDCPP